MYKLLLITFLSTCTIQIFAQKPEVVVQRGHNAAIKAVAFTPNGKYLLSGSRDKTIKLWEISSGRELRTYFGHESTVNDISVSLDGQFFVTSSADKSARIWELTSGKFKTILLGHEDLLTAVEIVPKSNQVISAGYDRQAFLWDLNTTDSLKTYKVNPDKGLGYGVNLAVHPEGKIVAFGNDNRTATLVELATGRIIKEIKPPTGYCGGCATFVDYSAEGEQLVKASKGSSMILVDGKNGDLIREIAFVKHEITALEMNGKGDILMTSEDSISVYDNKGKLKFKKFRSHHLPITDATFSPDGQLIALASDDQTISLISTEKGELIRTLTGYLNMADKGGLAYDPNSRWDYYIKKYTDLKNDFAVSPDGRYLVKGKIGSIARMWELKTGLVTNEFRGHDKAVLAISFSPDGKLLATGSADNKIGIWNAGSGELIRMLSGHRELVFDIKFSNDQKHLMSSSWDGTVKIWDLESGEDVETLRLEAGSSYQTVFFNDPIYCITAGLDKTLRMWEIDSKQPVRDFIGHTDIIHSIALHPKTNQLISASWDGSVKIWDIASGLQEKKLTHHKGPVYVVSYNNSGSLIATGGADRTINILNGVNWELNQVLQGHTGAVTNLQFLPDSEQLVSASDNGEIKIWDLKNGKELISYLILSEKDWMAINADGYFNATETAIRSIAIVDGMNSYSAEQFYDQFFQPDLLNSTFQKEDKSLNMRDKIDQFPPPKVTIIAPKNDDKFRIEKADVLAKVENNGGGISRLKVVHNGKTVLLEEADVKNDRAAINHAINLVPGQNEIVVTAFSNGGIESEKETVLVQMDGEVQSTLYLFSIGINKYKNEELNLNYAGADAASFEKLIRERSKKLFSRVEVISLRDEEATKENIYNQLRMLSKLVKPQDVFMLYYAGHGSMVENNFYFIPTENVRLYSEEKLQKNAIYAGDLQQKLKEIKALKQLVIIDACQSGGSVELLATRGASEEKALAQLSRSAGIHVLAAAGSEQFATEFEDLGHGLFTYALLEALSGKADGAPADGKITIYELKSFIDDQVPEISRKFKGKMQFPYTFSRGHDFPIVID